MKYLTFLFALILSLTLSSAIAYYPVMQSITATINTSGYVQCSVYDPQTQTTITHYGSTNNTVTQLTNHGGIVAYTSGTGFSRYFHAVTYDPYKKSFQPYSYGLSSGVVTNLIVADGIVAYTSFISTFDNAMAAVTYDPSYQNGSWRPFSYGINTDTVNALISSDGVIACAYHSGFNTHDVHFAVYDPISQNWVGGYNGVFEVNNLQISDATVTFNSSSTSYSRGYDHQSGSWANGTTDIICSFYSAKADGYDPSYVWITDMSVAGTSWIYQYGDGAQSPSRSGHHEYTSGGSYNIDCEVFGNSGSTTCTVSYNAGSAGIDENILSTIGLHWIRSSDNSYDLIVDGHSSSQTFTLSVLDLTGKKLMEKLISCNGQERIKTNISVQGVYLVNIADKTGRSKTKSVIAY